MLLRRFFTNHGIKLFDVTMRDGLQSVKTMIPLEEKKAMVERLLKHRRPDSLEIGSLVSAKAMPQMATSIDLFKHTDEFIRQSTDLNTRLFMLVPPRFDRMCQAHELGVRNVSVMSSVSDDFQLKNVRQTTSQTISTITNSLRLLTFDSAKVYLSCVNECPVAKRKYATHHIADVVVEYAKIPQVSEICLSDTMGTLRWVTLREILEEARASGVLMDKISLHLHISGDDIYNMASLICMATSMGVTRIDVSDVGTGGCNMTLDEGQLHGNLTYEILEDCIWRHKSLGDFWYGRV